MQDLLPWVSLLSNGLLPATHSLRGVFCHDPPLNLSCVCNVMAQPKLPTVGVDDAVLKQLAALDPPITTVEGLLQWESTLYSRTRLTHTVR